MARARMKGRMKRFLVPAAAAGFLLMSGGEAGAQEQERGREVYERWCASCHGVDGDGLGPAAGYMLPRPRDFTRGLYQIRTTLGGEIPTDDDIMRMIDEGMPGTSMPGWRDQLSRRDREAVVAYIKGFYSPFETLPAAEPMDFGRAPRASDELLEEGRSYYDQIECWQCHGQTGRGDGPSAPEQVDDWGYPIRAADLTKNWRFTGGGSVEDIYRRLVTGLDGTPMPAHWDLVEGGFMTEEQLWGVAHYVRSLSPEREPQVREVIRAMRVEPGEVPGSLDDPAWDRSERFYIPMAGQIILLPRWFNPAVSSLWVQAIHDGGELALRITWTDRSRSPEPRWMEWQERVLDVMEPREGDEVEPGPRPDRLVVQFPVEIPTGMDRPFFLMGDSRSPVYLWTWQSDEPGARKATARGMRDIEPFQGGTLESEARWEDGEWQLLIRRPLEPEDPARELRFEPGVSIPIAFSAWDGDNGEDGTRGAVSSWFFVHLEREPPPSTYVAPLVAFVLTGGLGFFVVARAQRRERLRVEPEDEDEGEKRSTEPDPRTGHAGSEA